MTLDKIVDYLNKNIKEKYQVPSTTIFADGSGIIDFDIRFTEDKYFDDFTELEEIIESN